ncbi:MAG TPA: nucleotidyltransferase domain-containing protein [Longimicrobium sp.]|jgi:hypothetical protein|nr:nucleotidyltransferase domain-containing protein [Longimicrobium sp.]
MTAPTPPGRDLLVPGLPGDAHRVAAEAMLRRLAAAFPQAGLGLTGSVATGTHGPESDLDLVMVDAGFRREMQFATVSEGIRTAVLCLRPELDEERERRWMLAAGGDVRMVSMVRSAVVARDPSGVLGELQRTIARLDRERRTRREELVADRRAHALAAVRALHGGGASDEHLQLELFTTIVDGWFLRRGLAMDTRQESERMLETIAGRDAALSTLLREAVPLTQRSLAPLLRAVDYVFGQVSDAD